MEGWIGFLLALDSLYKKKEKKTNKAYPLILNIFTLIH